MADSYTTLNGVSVAGGDSVDMESVTYGSAPTTRKRTRTVITGTAAAAIADVVNSTPSTSAYGLPVRLAGPTVGTSIPGATDAGLTVRQCGPVSDYSGLKWKVLNTGSTQTGTALWTPASGKKIAVTYIQALTSTTATSALTLWFGASGDTTYTEGTDQLVFYVPGNAADNRIFWALPHPIPSLTADYILRVTSTNNLPLVVTVGGYEF